VTALLLTFGEDFLWLILCMAIGGALIGAVAGAWTGLVAAHHWVLARRVVAAADRITRDAAGEHATDRA
jgi:hypothetical protein